MQYLRLTLWQRHLDERHWANLIFYCVHSDIHNLYKYKRISGNIWSCLTLFNSSLIHIFIRTLGDFIKISSSYKDLFGSTWGSWILMFMKHANFWKEVLPKELLYIISDRPKHLSQHIFILIRNINSIIE